MDHALSCPTGAFPTIRHNEICDLTAKLMTEVCPDVCAEPQLKPLTGENLSYATANKEKILLDLISKQVVFWDHGNSVPILM